MVSDLSVLRASAHDYLQPMVTISGGLVALGMAPWLALLVWKPVVLIAIFVALRACYHRVLAGRAERRAAVALGLFAAGWASLGEEWIPSLSWGYLWPWPRWPRWWARLWPTTAHACSVTVFGRRRS